MIPLSFDISDGSLHFCREIWEPRMTTRSRLRECLQKVDPKSVYVKLELSEGEKPMAERFCYLVYPKHLQLPEAKLDLSVQKEGDVIRVDVKSDVFAKDVQVSSTSRYGVFYDNYFDLEAGQTRRITFKSVVQEENVVFSARSL